MIHHEIHGKGHGGIAPPRHLFDRVLAAERVHHPAQIDHRFRYLHQAHAYWVEGHVWSGPAWDRPRPPVRRQRGETEGAALWRTLRELLGEIRGWVEGQRVTVETRKLGDLTVWFGDGMIDWQRPVTLVHNGREVFRGVLVPGPAVALAQAVRTRDFSRLRWAGIRIDAGRGSARVVKGEDPFPPILREL